MSRPRLVNDPSACTLDAGDLQAVFLPRAGMLGASLRHKGMEILGRVQDLEAAAAKGSSVGVPLLHPWANRLAGLRYRAAKHEVTSIRGTRFCTSTSTGSRCMAFRGRCSPGRRLERRNTVLRPVSTGPAAIS